ncbi:UNKNOWN [Stylonychia lemnae]|uniref:Uncharacterized protein n=1 Tax=Stylonychia lemnae TaxID=5949 RepID=A0A078ARQ9_STYLE|nr:UNKNOWN [Stylonychia lemnae]|eukprot:CDW83553.1 UNKNOWN [Stylonychia lemnae]
MGSVFYSQKYFQIQSQMRYFSASSNNTPSSGNHKQNVFTKPSSQTNNEADAASQTKQYEQYAEPQASEFDDLQDADVKDKDSAAKNLSLQLMKFETSEQCLQLYENGYLRGARDAIYGEELCLIFYFVIKNIQKMMPEDGHRLLTQDLRFTTLLQMIMGRLQDLEFEYFITTVWGLGIAVSGYNAQIEPEQKLRILSHLNQIQIPEYAYNNIPTLAFSLSCFFNEDMNQLAQETIEKISNTYLDNMLDRMDILQASVLLMSWGRAFIDNGEMLDKVANDIINKHKQKLFYEDGAISEIVNIIMALSDLRYKNEKLFEIMHGYALKHLEKLNIYFLAQLVNSTAMLFPEKIKYFNDYSSELHQRLQAGINQESFRVAKPGQTQMLINELIPDITTYNNLWLSITCFGVKQNVTMKEDIPADADEEKKKAYMVGGHIRVIAKDLIKIFNSNRRWQNTDLNITEAANISIAIASLKLQSDNFIADIADIIKANIKEANNYELINLAKSSHYFREFKHTKELYGIVHAECVTRYNLRKLDDDVKSSLESVFSSHGIMNDSPFVKTRVQR